MPNFLFSRIKPLLFLSTAIFFTLAAHAQKNSQIWEALLHNKRDIALEMVGNLKYEGDIENALLKKIVEMENGIMTVDRDFVSTIANYDDYENYLFSNWILPYFFSEYLDNGFSEDTYKIPHLVDASKINNSTVKNGLYYLQAIAMRHQKKWEDYEERISKINAIREWEYCGVFENLNSSGIEMSYAPEEYVSPNTIFDAHSNGDAKWYTSGKDGDVYKFFTNHGEYGSGVHYAQSFIYSPIDQRVLVKLGKDGLIRLWVNDVLVLENDESYITELDSYTYAINLQKGVNRFLVKSASNSGTPYFILRLEDLKGNPLKNYNVSFKDRRYKKGTTQSVNPELIPHSIEAYFEKKLAESKGDVNLTKYCLFLTYYRNGRLNKALALLNDWSKQYPESSFIKANLIECHSVMGNTNEKSKVENNLKRKDPDYYLSLLLEFENFDELMNLDIEVYESTMKKIGTIVDYPFMKTSTDLMIYLRRVDMENMRLKLDELMVDTTVPSSIKPTFSEFYSSVFNDDDATITVLERFNDTEYNWEIIQYLAYYYEKQNRIEDVISLYEYCLDKFDEDNNVHYKLISILHDTGQFERSLPFIEQALQNYPNSRLFTKLKGNAYLQLNRTKEAIELYEKALRSKPSDHDLRSKINDLRNRKNPLNEFHIDDAYAYIDKTRNTITQNNYGLNVLLKQSNILAYKNGGGEYKTVMTYEITSQNGVDIFKEYSLGLYGDYTINKSELVKPDGDTVPADRNGSDLVFDELEIGDVVYIDYEAKYTRYGRFYNSYIFNHSFTGYHPTIKSTYRVLTHDKKINHEIFNGPVGYKSYPKEDLYVHEWEMNNVPGIPISEDYMPSYKDVTTRLSISSIDSWDEIATWYSDLVRKQLKFDEVVENEFNSIFPKGYRHLSETERAKRIYYYITDHLNYSHVSFKQSGFVPQKPSKTINTKLGDCKDFSSLFLVLAQQAELDAKLVLILTSDYGKNELVLPSTDFNHCIVKVTMDGTEQFLELTDKYLPFRSLPMSLRDATALEIPFDSSKKSKSELFRLKDQPRQESLMESSYVLDLDKTTSTIELTYKVSGHLGSYYIGTFDQQKDKLLEDTISQEISNMSSEPVQLIGIENVSFEKEKGIVEYTTKLTSKLKINKVGELFMFKIPYFLTPYDRSIIQPESRSYPIDYKQYENSDSYKETMLVRIKENEKFVEIPENVKYQFKEHSFSVNYELLKPNSITTVEYAEFKDYVTKVLDARDNLISFNLDNN